MVRADVVTLIAESPAAHGVFENHEDKERTVYCTVRSASMRETYEAMGHGLKPEVVLKLTCDADYDGEKKCVFRNVPYRIIRHYLTDDAGVELILERSNADV